MPSSVVVIVYISIYSIVLYNAPFLIEVCLLLQKMMRLAIELYFLFAAAAAATSLCDVERDDEVVPGPRNGSFESVSILINLLDRIEISVPLPLSHRLVVVRPESNFSACHCSGECFEPSLCLRELKGYGFHDFAVQLQYMNESESRLFSYSLRMVDRKKGEDRGGPSWYSSHYETNSRSDLWRHIDSVWRKHIELMSIDIAIFHYWAITCHSISKLFDGGAILPKILLVPITPTTTIATTAIHDNASMLEDDFEVWKHWHCSLSDAIDKYIPKKTYKFYSLLKNTPYAIFLRKDIHSEIAEEEEQEVTNDEQRPVWLPSHLPLPQPSAAATTTTTNTADQQTPHGLLLYTNNDETATRIESVEEAVDLDAECEFLENARGYGNDDSVQVLFYDLYTEDECFEVCNRMNRQQHSNSRRRKCFYWTFDPTMMFGASFCWLWINKMPEKVVVQDGFFGGGCTDRSLVED